MIGFCSIMLQVLVLADNTFQPFPSDTTPASAALHGLSGEVLQLREHGLKARDAFEQEVRYTSKLRKICNEAVLFSQSTSHLTPTPA